MQGFATYVFLDLATSPLKGDPKPGITELSMVALERSDISTLEETLPRLRNKLTMCIKTDKELPLSYQLSNEVLEDEAPFDKKVFDNINLFLRCQKKPLCLIAHHGFHFDFPVLANHLMKIDVWLDEDVMCTDSSYMFNEVVPKNKLQKQNPPTLKNTLSMQQLNSISDPKPLRLGRRKVYNKIIDIYNNEFSSGGVKKQNHFSEDDCLLMAEVFIKYAAECLQWVDNNYSRFSDYKTEDLSVG